MEFLNHEQYGNLLLHYDDNVSAGIVISEEQAVPLEDSGHINCVFMFGGGFVLGCDLIWKCYHPKFVAAGYRRARESFPMALWDAQTGRKLTTLQGLHTGSLRGVKRLDDKRLITWARDFRVFVWDIRTGECLGEYTTPVLIDQEGYAIVSSRNGEDYSAEDWLDYIGGCGKPGFNVTIYLKSDPDGQQDQLGPFKGVEGRETMIRRYEPDDRQLLEHRNILHRIQDLEGAEAGYSTPFRLKDGRIGIGGTTYGAWEQVFVWDGLRDLSILVPGRLNVDCQIDGEIAPNTIRINNHTETYTFEDI